MQHYSSGSGEHREQSFLRRILSLNGAMAHGRGVAYAGRFDLGLYRVEGQLHYAET